MPIANGGKAGVERTMRRLVRRFVARLAAPLRGFAAKRPAEAPLLKRAEAEIDVPARIYRIAASARPGAPVRGWSVQCDDRADAVAAGLTLAQARTLCRLLNGVGGCAAANRGLSAGVKPPRSQSPEI